MRTLGPDLNLNARAALALSIALHELFTNGVKYGALAIDRGTIAPSWTIGAGHDDRTTFEMLWQEQGGPPVSLPAKKGFGSRLTGSSLAGDLGGGCAVDYAVDGVRWRLATILAAISEQASQ